MYCRILSLRAPLSVSHRVSFGLASFNPCNFIRNQKGDENGKPWVLPSVRAAERILLDDPNDNKEYLPIDGDKEFVDAALRFAYGEETPQDHLAGIQTLSGECLRACVRRNSCAVE